MKIIKYSIILKISDKKEDLINSIEFYANKDDVKTPFNTEYIGNIMKAALVLYLEKVKELYPQDKYVAFVFEQEKRKEIFNGN